MDEILFWKQQVEFHPVSVEGHVESRGGCNGIPAVIMSGHGVTDANGEWFMNIADAVCGIVADPVDDLPTFVATPTSLGKPEPVTISAAIHGSVIYVQSWSLAAGKAPNVTFSWFLMYRSFGF